MDLLTAYLPQDRAYALARGVDLPERTSGAALFADISGFTPLTEALTAALGPRHGVEILTDKINAVYEALIAQVEQYHGSVVSFAGDAITCWFDDLDGPAASSAATCGLAMQAVMTPFAAVALPDSSMIALTIKIAIASGPARRFVAGDPTFQQLDVLAGTTMAHLAVGEHLAAKGEVLIDELTAASLGAAATLATWRTDDVLGIRFALITRIDVAAPTQPWPRLLPGSLRADQLQAWMLPNVAALVQAGLGAFLTELRPAISLFLRFDGIDYDSDPAAGEHLDAFVRAVQAVLARYDGTLLQLTIGDKGSYLYAAFGAPVSHEDDARRAILAALALQQVGDAQLELAALQIGISQGISRCGAYGGSTRRIYGVMGDDVNLASRLMSLAARGEILISGRVQSAIGDQFVFDARPPIPLKGKAEPLPVFAVQGLVRRRTVRLEEPAYVLPMVGRVDELAQGAATLAQALTGQVQVLGITAEAGLGKSRLVAEIVRLAMRAGMAGYGGTCQSYGTTTPYLVWQPIWRAFFDIDPGLPLRKQLRRLERAIADLAPDRLQALSLLGPLLELDIPENDFTRSLEPQFRRSALHALLLDCLKGAAREAQEDRSGVLLVLEDLHWIDAASHDLLEQVARTIIDVPVLIILAYRPPDLLRLQSPRVEALPHFTSLTLTDLDAGAAEALIRAKLAQLFPEQRGTAPAKLIAQVIAKAQGNPFYIEELLNYLRDRGLDPRTPAALAALELPSSLHSLILSRIDQLSAHEQATLKTASIIGRVFRAAHLQDAYPELGNAAMLRTDLDELARLELTPLDMPEPELAYLFKHIVTQEVAYTSLPAVTRAVLHERFAAYLEGLTDLLAERFLDLLAYHYERSDNLAKKREYLWRAGEAAAARYARAEADAYFSRALELTPPEDLEDRYSLLQARREVVFDPSRRKQDLSELEALAEALDDDRKRAEVAGYESADVHELPRKYAAAERMLALATATADSALVIDAHVSCAVALWSQRQNRAAQEHALIARALARTAGDRKREGTAVFCLAVVAMNLADPVAARVLDEEALQIYRAIGDRGSESITIGNLGVALALLGDYAAATHCFEQHLRMSHEVGVSGGNPYALQNLGWMAHLQGDDERARSYAEQACSVGRSFGDQFIEAAALTDLGHALVGLGRANEAVTSYQAALTIFEDLGYHDQAGEPQAGLARVALAARDHRGALAAIVPTLAYLAEGGTFDGTDEGLRIELTCYQVLAAADDPRAAAVLAAAHTRLQSRATAISDDEMRRMFLEQVPWHRELVLAWVAAQAAP
jgi:class 3 adenylate cyclase/tetratricopeptide (TPR) repeat protein